jgi:uracil-DNA glycosylase family 4
MRLRQPTPDPPLHLAAVQGSIAACNRCTRLRAYCRRVARIRKPAHAHDTYWGRPVPGFGDSTARLLVLGLAPAAHGANRTGRVFTGDGSGDFLMRAMHATGFASHPVSPRVDDGLTLRNAYIAAAVRCAPPDNKPTPAEIEACQQHLDAEWEALARIGVVVALGRIAFAAALARFARAHGRLRPRPAFAHGAEFHAPGRELLIASYHPSRQNTNTGRLTADMLRAVFERAREWLGGLHAGASRITLPVSGELDAQRNACLDRGGRPARLDAGDVANDWSSHGNGPEGPALRRARSEGRGTRTTRSGIRVE